MDADTRQVVAVHVGDRTAPAGREFREPVPEGCRGRVPVPTGLWAA